MPVPRAKCPPFYISRVLLGYQLSCKNLVNWILNTSWICLSWATNGAIITHSTRTHPTMPTALHTNSKKQSSFSFKGFGIGSVVAACWAWIKKLWVRTSSHGSALLIPEVNVVDIQLKVGSWRRLMSLRSAPNTHDWRSYYMQGRVPQRVWSEDPCSFAPACLYLPPR